MKLSTILLTASLLLAITLNSCKDDEQVIEPEEDFVSDFYPNATTLNIVVAYEDGGEPYTNYNTFTSWDICEDNITKLLSSKSISVSVPKSLDEMVSLGKKEQGNYTRENLIQFAEDISSTDSKGPTKEVILLFLDGYYVRDNAPETRILGVNLDGTNIIAVFKPVVKSASNSTAEQALIEQTTVVHEIGHALGLVNKGVRATTAHHDEANGAHCTNTDCVMYWKNGGAEIQQFITPFLTTGTVDLFGSQCIADVTAK